MDLMSLMIRIGADITNATEGIDKVKTTLQDAEKKSDDFKTKFVNVFKTIAKLAVVKTAVQSVYNLSKAAFDAYASYEQLSGGVETLFKGSAEQVQKYANEAYRTAGLSANDYMSTVTSFSAAMIQSLGGDTAKAAELSNQAIIDMADNANKMGSSMESIQTAYQGFSKQNYTMLDNLKLGYGGTKSEMDRLIQDAARMDSTFKYNTKTVIKNKKAVEELDYNYADIVRAIHIVQTNMGITGTTAAEAADTIEGSVASTKAAWSNLVLAIGRGEGIGEAMDALIASGKNVVKNAIPVIKRIASSFGEVFTRLGKMAADGMKDLGKKLLKLMPANVRTALITTFNKARKILDNFGITKAIQKRINQIKNLFTGKFNFKAIFGKWFSWGDMTANPLTGMMEYLNPIQKFIDKIAQNPAIKNIIDGFSGAFSTLKTAFADIKKELEPVIQAFQNLWNAAVHFIEGDWSLVNLKYAWDNFVMTLQYIDWNGIKQKIIDAFSNAWQQIQNIDWIGLGTTIWDKIKGGFNAVGDWIKQLVLGDEYTPDSSWGDVGDKIWGAIKAGITAVGDWIKGLVLGEDYTPDSTWADVGDKIWGAIKGGITAVGDWIKGLVLGEEYTPDSTWGDVGDKIWGAIKNGFAVANDWLLKLLLGEGYTPESDWGDVGNNIWTAIKTGFGIASDWLLKLLLGEGYTPESDWGTVGENIWNAIKTGFGIASDWLLKLLLGDGYTPEADWGTVGENIWSAIKTGFGIASDWLVKLLLGDKYTPESDWAQVGSDIWAKILEGLGSAVDWLKNLFTDWTTKLTDGSISFYDIGYTVANTIYGAIVDVFNTIIDWFSTLFGGTSEDDPNSVKGAIGGIDWAGLGTSMFNLITAAFNGIVDLVKGWFVGVWEAVNNLNWAGLGRNMWNAIKKAFAKIADWFKETFKSPINAVIGLINGMLGRLETGINNIVRSIKSALTIDMPDWLGGAHWEPNINEVSFTRIRALAKGGTVFPGDTAIVGEAGAELLRNVNGRAVVTPLGGGTGGDNIAINIYQQPGESAEALAEKVQRVLVRQERQRRAYT